jgi:hypothetical protein
MANESLIYQPDWNKQYYCPAAEAATLASEHNIGFDLWWCDCTMLSSQGCGWRIPVRHGHGGKYRVHQDSICKYETLKGMAV